MVSMGRAGPARRWLMGVMFAMASAIWGCAPAGDSDAIVIRRISVIDPEVGVTEDVDLRIEGARITVLGEPGRRLPSVRASREIDGSGLFVIPGLWDAHVHLSKGGESLLGPLVANGVTTVRDMGGDWAWIQDTRERIGNRELLGPGIMAPGPMLEAPATLERMRESSSIEAYNVTRIAIADTMRARSVADSLIDLGVDFIKIREFATPEAYRAVVEAARDRGVPVVGHAPFGMETTEGISLGLVSLEHGSYPYPLPDGNDRERIVDAFLESGTAITPTMSAWRVYLLDPDSLRVLVADTAGQRDPRMEILPEKLRRAWVEDLSDREALSAAAFRGWQEFYARSARDFSALHDRGVPLLAGSDLATVGLFPGWALHQELERMVDEIGLTPREALAAATSVPAALMGVSDTLGAVEVGKRADLVLLRANPLEDIRNTRAIAGVVLGGRYLDSLALSGLLRGLSPSDGGEIELLVAPGGS